MKSELEKRLELETTDPAINEADLNRRTSMSIRRHSRFKPRWPLSEMPPRLIELTDVD